MKYARKHPDAAAGSANMQNVKALCRNEICKNMEHIKVIDICLK